VMLPIMSLDLPVSFPRELFPSTQQTAMLATGRGIESPHERSWFHS
jgi:hypothetical protein